MKGYKGYNMKKSTKKLIFISFFMIIFCVVVSFIIYNIKRVQLEKNYQIKMEEQERILDEKKRVAYFAKKSIKVGERITNKNIEKKLYYSDSPQQSFINEEDIGKLALISLKKDTVIFRSMVTKKEQDESMREQEFTEINLSANLKNNDLVDVRIVYPNGESFIVLARKSLKSIVKESNACYIDLNAEELDRIQSAFVDAYLNKATLYSVRYIQDSLVDGSIVTYTPSTEVIELIKSDPNITKISSDYLSESARRSLESRLYMFRKVLANRQLEEKQQEKKLIEYTENNDENDSNESDSEDETEGNEKEDIEEEQVQKQEQEVDFDE